MTYPKQILLVEDDFTQSDLLTRELREAIPGVQVHRLSTEQQVHALIESGPEKLPDVIILDEMLLWQTPGQTFNTPADWNGHARAGVRCAKLLASDRRTKDIPIIIFTILSEDITREIAGLSNVTYIMKEHNTIDNLLQALSQL